MHREWKPLNPRPVGPTRRMHWATFVLLAVVVAVLGGVLGRLYCGVRALFFGWWS